MTEAGNVVADTVAELGEDFDRERVLSRLADWRDRVHRLYDEVEAELGGDYAYDRQGKYLSQEAVVQRAGLRSSDVPPIDILRVRSPSGSSAVFLPRHLWMIGANGRIDLFVVPKTGLGRRHFMLIDVSRPLAGPSDWRLVFPAERLDELPFHVHALRELLA